MMKMMNENLPLYPRIAAYADASYGEDIVCLPCGEIRAVCPDCTAALCVFCETECSGCEGSVW